MPTITVMAPDSALAMDEVIRQLGDGAYILSTSQQDGMIQIKATNDPMNAVPKRANAVQTVFEDELEHQFWGGTGPRVSVTMNDGAPRSGASERPKLVAISGERVNAEQSAARLGNAFGAKEPTDIEHAVSTELPRCWSEQQSKEVTKQPTDLLRSLNDLLDKPPEPSEAIKAQDVAQETEPAALEAEHTPDAVSFADQEPSVETRLRRLEDALGLDPIEPSLPANTHTPYVGQDLLLKGISAPLLAAALNELASFEEAEQPISQSDVVSFLAETMVSSQASLALDADVLFVIGASGSGKTTLSAKFAALLAETREERAIALIDLQDATSPRMGLLTHLGRLINVPVREWDTERTEDWAVPGAGQSLIVDVSCSLEELQGLWPLLQAKFEGKRFHTVLAQSSGASTARIEQVLDAAAALKPEVVLTKLDECECSLVELSAVMTGQAKIGWLAGTRSLVGNLAQASALIMEQYIVGCLTQENQNTPEAELDASE